MPPPREGVMIKVYVAGPYTKGDVAVNVATAIEMADVLFSHGYAPFLPHLTHFWHLCQPRPYPDWIKLDLVWLEQCDALLRFPGESRGADTEVQHARELGMPVFFSIEELCTAMPYSMEL
jgi:hypothetical protein